MKKLTKPDTPHYNGEVEYIDLVVALGDGPAFCRGNIFKYLSRYEKKGEKMKDLQKALQYMKWLIELEGDSGESSK